MRAGMAGEFVWGGTATKVYRGGKLYECSRTQQKRRDPHQVNEDGGKAQRQRQSGTMKIKIAKVKGRIPSLKIGRCAPFKMGKRAS